MRVAGLRWVRQVHLLPYHNFGSYKYAKLGLRYTLDGLAKPEEERVERAKAILESRSLEVRVGG